MVWPCRFVLQQVTLFSLITQWVKTGSLGFYIETFCGDKDFGAIKLQDKIKYVICKSRGF